MPDSLPPTRRRLTGVCPPARGAVLAELIRREPAPVWLAVTDTESAAEQLAAEAVFLHQALGAPRELRALVFPEARPDAGELREAFTASSDRLAVLSRLKALRGLSSTPDTLLVTTTPAALLQPVPALEAFTRSELVLARGARQPFAALREELHRLDYDSEAVCEAPGHYAIRGGLVDIYPVTADRPYRIDFFGDEIEAIREFDPVTQRSGATVETITIPASPRVRLAHSDTGLGGYLTDTARLVLVEPALLEAEFAALAPAGADPLGALLARVAAVTGLGDLDEASAAFADGTEESTWDTEELAHHRRQPGEGLIAQERLAAEEAARREFLDRVAAWRRAGDTVAVVISTEGEEQRVRELLAAETRWKILRPRWWRGVLGAGFRVGARPGAALALGGRDDGAEAGGGLVVVTEAELLGRRRPRRAGGPARAVAHRSHVDQLLDFAELVEGDFVVHLQHGIAHYRGITRLDTAQGVREVISLEFDDQVTLHVPLTESHLISRYVGLSKARPQLGRIGSGRWEKARQAAERATVDLAADLLRLQAAREAEPGHAFPADNDWQREFETSFTHVETPDQLRAIRETKADLERARPMDRLICGDVGFGKTEVAIRAAFKVVQGGRQVAVLVPTTVLAQQHLNTFRERMAGYPIAIEMLSRFRSRSETRQVLAATAAGQVDILIGTHRLLQGDVVFRGLGMVVVDEEQRFGVKHKEALKRLRTSVDVLSLSATPIPRTLYLALTGARDLSVIETPPVDRHPIQTIVKTYDEKVVLDAIHFELRRGGQVFYLHNRVQTIAAVAARLRELLPGVPIGVGHGQMDAAELEEVMTEFVAGRHRVLVATTIIESGLDIPNSNTIIIEGADRFGLSQLYQLRGRVGRFRHQAYAYLLLHRHTRLLEIARQRLTALRQHNQLGAGFRIAMRDLELRGAGNLLGAEQSGHIVGVGFELYCQLLRQSVARLKGETTAAALRATVKLDFVFVGDGTPEARGTRRHEDGYTALKDAEDAGAADVGRIQARLPAGYVTETRLRIDFYRKLALADTLPALRQIEADLRDRFGRFGDEVRALLLVTEIRVRAEQRGVLSVETDSGRLKCRRRAGGREDWVQVGARFPRLTAPTPLLRLREISAFLDQLPPP